MQQEVWYKKTWSFFKETWEYWSSFRPTRMASSLSYYGLFALAPLLVITFWMGSLILQSQVLELEIIHRVAYILGPSSVSFLQTTFDGALSIGNYPLTAAITVVFLLLFALTGFDELKQSLDELWQAVPSKPGFLSTLSRYFFSLVAIIVFGIVFILFILITRFFQAGFTFGINPAMSQWISTIGAPVLLFIVTIIGTFLTYVVLPEHQMSRSHLLVGSLITGVFLMLGNIVLERYLAYGATLSAYGVAGSIVAVLLWFYYSSLIFLFGACATWVYNRRHNS